MEIPKDVKDKKKYLQYKALEKHRIVTTDKYQTASDGTVINMAWFNNILKKKIAHLPVAEQEIFLSEKEEYYSINNKMTALKRQAMGLVQGWASVKAQGDNSITKMKKTELLEYFGRMFTVDEVVEIVNKEWGVPVQKQAIQKFRTKNGKQIQDLIEKFKLSHVDMRLGVKRSRLEELTYLYGLQKDKFEETKRNDNYSLLLRTLEQIRKEAEGDRLTIDGKVDIKYEVDIQQHLMNEVFKTLNLKEIVLSRVAARMGLNPVKLIHSLNTSYYKKFSNVLGDYNPDENSDVPFPSQLNYDFERIGKAQSILDKYAEDAVIEEQQKAPKRDEEQANDIKDQLLQKLLAKKKNFSKVKTEIDSKDKSR
jgi:hypothetical protein